MADRGHAAGQAAGSPPHGGSGKGPPQSSRPLLVGQQTETDVRSSRNAILEKLNVGKLLPREVAAASEKHAQQAASRNSVPQQGPSAVGRVLAPVVTRKEMPPATSSVLQHGASPLASGRHISGTQSAALSSRPSAAPAPIVAPAQRPVATPASRPSGSHLPSAANPAGTSPAKAAAQPAAAPSQSIRRTANGGAIPPQIHTGANQAGSPVLQYHQHSPTVLQPSHTGVDVRQPSYQQNVQHLLLPGSTPQIYIPIPYATTSAGVMAQSGALHGSQPSFPNSAFLPGHYSVGATAAGPQILYAKQTTQPLAGQQQLQLSQMQVQNLGSGSPVLTIPATFSPRSAPSSATTPPTGEPLPADAKYIYLSLLATVKTLRTAHVRLTSPSLTPTYYAQACDDLLLHFARPHAYIAPLAGLTSAVLLAVCEAGLRPGFEGVREKGRALIRLAYIEGVDVLEDSPFETGVELDGAPWLLGMDTQSLKQLYKRISGPKVREGQRDGTEELGTKPDGARPETPVDTKDGMARLRREQLSSASPAPSESSKPPITPVEPSKESLPTPMSAESAATRAAGVRTSPAPNEPAVVAESARPTVNMAEAEAVPIFDPAADLLSGSLEGLRGLLNIGLVRQDPLPLKADHRKLPPRIIAPNTEPWDIKHYPRYLPVPKIGTVVSASYPILPNVPDLKGQDVRFYLSPHLLQAIRQKHVMLQLWSRRLPANAVLGPNLQLPRKLEHPEPLVSLLLNTHSVPLLRRRRKPNSDPAHDKWEGRDRPGELPAQYLVPGNNSLEIWWNGNDAYMPPGATREETPRWVLTIEAAVKLTAEDCRLLIHHPWHSNAEAAGRERVARIFRRVADGDVEEEALSSAKLSLRCPVAGTRMAMPVIGRKCKHPNCFDLESWLEMNKTKLTSKEPEWKCLVPLCGAPCGLEDVVLDQWTVRLLRDVPKDAEEVDLFPDLTWRVPVPEIADRHVEVVDLSDSDAEVPKQPTTEAAEVEVEAPDVVQDMEIDGHGAAQRQDELPTGSGEGEAEAEAEDGAVEAAEEETPESIEQRRIAKEERHRQKAERKAARAARRAERAAATQLAEEAAAPTENQEAEAENPEPSAGNDVVVISSDDDEPAPRPESKRAKKVKSRTQRAPEVEVEVALKAPETVPKKGKKHAALREPAAPEQSCGAAMVDGQRDSEAQAGFDDRQSARSASLEPPGSQSSQNVPSFAEAYPDIAAEMVTDPDSMLPDVRHKARYHPSNGDRIFTDPGALRPGSSMCVVFRCPTDPSHQYAMTVSQRVSKGKTADACPICRTEKRRLARDAAKAEVTPTPTPTPPPQARSPMTSKASKPQPSPLLGSKRKRGIPLTETHPGLAAMFIKDLDPKSELGQRCLTYTQNKGQLHQDPSKVSKGLHFLVAFQCKRNPQHRFANTIVKQSNLDDPEECPRCNRASSLAEAVLGRERGASVSASGDASDSDLASTSESELAPSRIKRRKVGAQAASPAPSAAEESPASTSSDDVPAAKRNIAKKTARPMLDHPIVTKKLKRHRDQSPERTSTPVSQRMPTPLAVKNETKGTLAVLGPRLVPKDEVSLSDGPFAKAFWRSQLPEDLRQDVSELLSSGGPSARPMPGPDFLFLAVQAALDASSGSAEARWKETLRTGKDASTNSWARSQPPTRSIPAALEQVSGGHGTARGLLAATKDAASFTIRTGARPRLTVASRQDLEGMAKRLATTDEKAQATLTALIEEAAVSQDTYDDSRFRKDLTFLTKVFHKAGGELKHQVLSLAPVPSVNVPAAQADS